MGRTGKTCFPSSFYDQFSNSSISDEKLLRESIFEESI